jgi:hypothetical protein
MIEMKKGQIMNPSFAPKHNPHKYETWLEENHSDIFEEWELSGAAEDMEIYDYVQRKHWRVHNQWYQYMEYGQGEK